MRQIPNILSFFGKNKIIKTVRKKLTNIKTHAHSYTNRKRSKHINNKMKNVILIATSE